MFTIEKAITDEMVKEKIEKLKTIHPIFASVAEGIHKMDLKETVNTMMAAETLETLLKIHAMREARGKSLTDEMTQQVVNKLKPKHPVFAEIVEKGSQLDLKETIGALIVVDSLQRLLKIHAARLATD